MNAIDLSGKAILITGGAGNGIASGLCEAVSKSGARLIINDKNKEALERSKSKFGDALIINADLCQEQEVKEMFDQISREKIVLGGLINNAGIGLSKVAHDVEESEYSRLFEVDVAAVWRVSKYFVNHCLAKNATGNIVNIASVHTRATQSRYALYCSAKNAVVGLTRGLACELGPLGFRVNAIGPGYVHADQNIDLIKSWTDDPLKWVEDFISDQQTLSYEVKAIDIGNTAAFLLSDLSRSITGQNIFVDAGVTSLLLNRSFT